MRTGIDAEHGSSDNDLVDQRLGDSCVTGAAGANLHLDPEATNQIRIMKSPRCGGHP